MGLNYLWDTNAVIDYLQQQLPQNAEKFIDNLLEENQPVISAITEIELLCWRVAAEQDIEVINKFIASCHIIELEKSVKLETVQIRKFYRVKLPDAIIAASAIVNNLTLLTRNIKDFRIIEKLKVINPREA